MIPPISDLDSEHDRLIEMGPDLDFTTIAIFEACLYKEFDPKKITIQTFKIMMQLRETSSETYFRRKLHIPHICLLYSSFFTNNQSTNMAICKCSVLLEKQVGVCELHYMISSRCRASPPIPNGLFALPTKNCPQKTILSPKGTLRF